MIIDRNKYCEFKSLTNESSVEMFFINRLLSDLGWSDAQIRTKESIDSLKVSMGRKKAPYKPDYILLKKNLPLVVVDAKAPAEDLDKWSGQCASYCLEINKKQLTKPTQHFLLSNGNETRFYRWDEDEPQVIVKFEECFDGNESFEKLKRALHPKAYLKEKKEARAPRISSETTQHAFKRVNASELNQAFAWCHQRIYKKDNLSQGSAFMEFVKLMFVKLNSDKAVRKKHKIPGEKSKYTVPVEDVTFSSEWIKRNSTSTNPVSDVLFVKLRNELEHQIAKGQKKRIFEKDEIIDLSPETISSVVEKLEHYDLYSLDSDLNGRLFETFLNATMRGKDLGQYFTPRSVVKLMIAMADITVGKSSADTPIVMDPCCGK